MKKRVTCMLIALCMMAGIASAATTYDFRWNYFRSSSAGISMSDGGIDWEGDASTYSTQSVTSTKIVVKLQVATEVGWGTITSATDTDKNDAMTGGTYTDWVKGESYRVAVEAWAYNGSKELEHIGPFYDYLYT